jgi:hypothetical protein
MLNKENITYQDLVNSDADVLIISCAYNWEFTDSEIEAITRYIKEGHGLIGTAGTLYYEVPNNNKLAPLWGMRDDLSYDVTEFKYLNILNITHPLFRDVLSPYYPATPTTATPPDWVWNDTDLVGGAYIAISDNNASATIVYRNVTFIAHWIAKSANIDDKQVLYNTITWSRYEVPEHDLEVLTLEMPPYLRPNQTLVIKTTIANFGLANETDVEVQFLVNGSLINTTNITVASMELVDLNFTWSNETEGLYNLTIYVTPVPNETLTANNRKMKDLLISSAKILLVDDDKGAGYEIYYENALVAINQSYIKWDRQTYGAPSGEVLLDFEKVVWFTGDDLTTTLTSEEQAALQTYLDEGGMLFISGQDIGYDIAWSYPDFYANYLHAEYIRDNTGIYDLEGVAGDPIGDGLVIRIEGGDGANNQRWPDEIAPADAYTTPVFTYIGNGHGAIKADALTHKVVYFSFGFEAINNSADRNEVMNRTINWLQVFEHDLAVTDLVMPTYAKPNEMIDINVTITNKGIKDEANVEVIFFVNGSAIEAAEIPTLPNRTSIVIDFAWLNETEGIYNISIWVEPVAGEVYTVNNLRSKFLMITPKDLIKAAVLDSWGTDNSAAHTTWDDLNENWMFYGTTPIHIDYTSLNKEGITYEDLISSAADVLIISCACGADWEFTDSEILAITKYVKEGRGLIGTAGTLYYEVPNNNKLAPLWGMRDDLSYDVTEFKYLNILDPTHPLFKKISSPYYPNTPVSATPPDFIWNDTDLAGGSFVALSDNFAGAVIVYQNVTYITHWPANSANTKDKQLLYNAITWSKFLSEVKIDIYSFESEKPSYLRGQTINISVGLNNTGDVEQWYVVVTSGTHKFTGYPLVGTSTVKIPPGETIKAPVMVPIHSKADTGTYLFYSDVYTLVNGKIGDRVGYFLISVPVEIS